VEAALETATRMTCHAVDGRPGQSGHPDRATRPYRQAQAWAPSGRRCPPPGENRRSSACPASCRPPSWRLGSAEATRVEARWPARCQWRAVRLRDWGTEAREGRPRGRSTGLLLPGTRRSPPAPDPAADPRCRWPEQPPKRKAFCQESGLGIGGWNGRRGEQGSEVGT
jgi:hypothetical protein